MTGTIDVMGPPRAAASRKRPGQPATAVSGRLLAIHGLHVQVGGREILRGFDLIIEPGEVHALMGPNGSGKTTLAHTLAGLPRYRVVGGAVRYKGHDLLALEIDERARQGLFVAFQYPVGIPGVRLADVLRLAVRSRLGAPGASAFDALLEENLKLLKIDRAMLRRYLNEGFSGGEKKRAEILQMAMLRPDLAVLDETDSGLDIDALRTVGEGVRAQYEQRPTMGVLIITHYPRLLDYVRPKAVHVMAGGRIIRSGGPSLAQEIEERGYGWLLEQAGLVEELAQLDVDERDGTGAPADPFRW